MPGASDRIGLATALTLGLLLAGTVAPRSLAQSKEPQSPTGNDPTTITNLAQMTRALESEERLCRGVSLEGVVCAASRPELGVLVLQDATGVELLELGRLAEGIPCGERIRIEGERSLLRRRELGVQISAAPVVDNDGLHARRVRTGEVQLRAGRVPLEAEWFNYLRNFGLEVSWQTPNGEMQRIPSPLLWHVRGQPHSAGTNLMPGLRVEC